MKKNLLSIIFVFSFISAHPALSKEILNSTELADPSDMDQSQEITPKTVSFLQGATGAMGPIGPAGPRGSKGDKGDKGDQGEKGDIGLPGAKGQTGDRGPAGIRGPKGATGIKGDIGEMGLTGATGEPGATGATGEAGSTGPEGPPGASLPLADTSIELKFSTIRVGSKHGYWKAFVIGPDQSKYSGPEINVQSSNTTFTIDVPPPALVGTYTIVLYNISIQNLNNNILSSLTATQIDGANTYKTKYSQFTTINSPGANQQFQYTVFLDP